MNYKIERKLPTVIIIGAMKAGTTAINVTLGLGRKNYSIKWKEKKTLFELDPEFYQRLPKMGMSDINHKEMDFFSKDKIYELGIDAYKKFFLVDNPEFCDRHPNIISECSPSYFCLDEYPGDVIGRIKKHVPDVKIILSLRDPIARTYSHYNHMIREDWNYDNYYQKLTFEEAVMGEWKPSTPNYIITRSFYYENLLKYKEAFGDKLFVITQESFLNDFTNTLKSIYHFLDIKRDNINNIKQWRPNTNKNSNYSINNINNKTMEYLKNLFSEDVKKTQELLPTIDFSHWNKY